jgi:hypothetical protein
MHRPTVFILATTCALAVVTHAHADCAEGARYDTGVASNTVTIGLANTSRVCPDTSGMLRQNDTTGEIDLLASYCGMGPDGESAYVDECVAPGTYRYGLAVPYSCTEGGCGGVEMFAEITVASALGTCTRAATDPGPTITNDAPPWGTGPSPAGGKNCGGGCACDTATASVASMNTFALFVGIAVVLTARKRRRA